MRGEAEGSEGSEAGHAGDLDENRRLPRMGVEYRHYLMPAARPFRPDAEVVLQLIGALRAARWIVDPGSPALEKMSFGVMADSEHAKRSGGYARTGERASALPEKLTVDALEELIAGDAILTWPVERIGDAGLEYPFEVEAVDPETYYDFQLHFCADYVHHASESIDPLDGLACCEPLEFEPAGEDIFYARRIRATCPACARPFDPSTKKTEVRDPWSGAARSLPGGAAYRFAIVIDCGKWLPNNDAAVPLRREFKQLCEKTLDQKLVDVGQVY